MNETLLNELADALQITSGCSPIQSELEAMPDDREITLTFCAADLKQIRTALAPLRAMQAERLECRKKREADRAAGIRRCIDCGDDVRSCECN